MAPTETELELSGDGPFLLPVCGHEVNVAIGEVLALVQFTTIQGQRVDVPLPVNALADLARNSRGFLT